ncbi:MAG: ATP-binding protein [Bacteroidetes bacterium]|nr:ATP-binding protein [Bacteroidota bacterium]
MEDHYKNILRYWRAIETFNLPDAPVAKWKKQFSDLKDGEDLPWEPGVLPSPKEGKQWRHTLYFHVVSKQDVISLLSRLSDSKEYREPVGGDTCLSAVVVNHLGLPVERTYSPAAFIYGIKIIREKMAQDELPGLLRKAGEDLMERDMIDWRALKKELRVLRELAHGELPLRAGVRCISEQVDEKATAEAPFLNSYYVKDLNNLIDSREDPGEPLKTFLLKDVDADARVDMLRQRVLFGKLHPRHQSPGRWPSDPSFGLYSAQQAALNTSLCGDAVLMGINGPPGTGKTTLLREIIADVVVRRARRILKFGVRNLFDTKWNVLDGSMGYYGINEALAGTEGIVVASNNNAAVENISKELPVANGIDRRSFGHADYFSEVASKIQDEPCWGMVSAALGRSDNRKAFISRFWFSKEHNFRKLLKERCQDPDVMRENELEYDRVAGRLTVLIEEFERFQGLAGEYHELLQEVLAGDGAGLERLDGFGDLLAAEFGLTPENLPDKGFLERSMGDIHQMTPYSSEKINILRSEIFLESLRLTALAIRLNARYFNANLNTFVNLSPNKPIAGLDEAVASRLWNCFFFCIPVVSVTLASFQRQFYNSGRGSIGWLLIDEAGQATLPSVCGAIWRAQRCIVIGDTLQIPPVVTIPRALGRFFQDKYGVGEEWSPLLHSAQFLADRVSTYGTYVGSSIWTGAPLRAHRRCSEPMFSVSNAIAYNGQMVKVSRDAGREYPTGISGWIDVVPITVSGHAVTEELQVAEDLIRMLVGFGARIFVISPFRSVVESCGSRFRQLYGVECGTIHSFQGKEAEVVILVLGTDRGAVAARNWVAESPNMLNVAVTRAKDRLYVIGSREAWGRHRYFDYLSGVLKKKDHHSGRLF